MWTDVRDVRRPQRPTGRAQWFWAAVAALLVVVGLAGTAPRSQPTPSYPPNPQVGQGSAWYVSPTNGMSYQGFQVGELWLSISNPWNGKFTTHNDPTSGKPARISNIDFTGKDFPFDVIRSDGVRETVTAAMSDEYWDHYYAGYTRISSSTFAQNDIGFATGLGYWMLARP